MNTVVSRFIIHTLTPPYGRNFTGVHVHVASSSRHRRFVTVAYSEDNKESMVVVGGGAAGIYGAIRAKTLAPNLNVVVIEKAKPLAKVKISGGGRCNVTNGHCVDNKILAEKYPRGSKEFRGSFFNTHGPGDTMSWFSDLGVKLKTEEDGRVFPVSDNSSTIIDCLLNEARRRGVTLQTGKSVTSASTSADGKFIVKIEKRTIDYLDFIEADYLLMASGSSQQGYNLAKQLGHSIIEPVPSLFTFKIDDIQLTELAGITFSKVKAIIKLESLQKNIPELTQIGPMLITHWGLSGPVILRLSAWGARDLFSSSYKGTLLVDFSPDHNSEDLKSLLSQHKKKFPKQKVVGSYPTELGIMKRFWKYLLNREGIDEDILWASISNNSLMSIAALLKQCSFLVKGKGQFKDEFVTAGGVPLSEISLKTMESRIQPRLFFAGEVLNADGITGGFNFQNAWSGGYIAGTSIGKMAATSAPAILTEHAV
ncbi:FAD/NAD(P)-binding oxidoreductase family protein [Artemisia annua]|uniref:FAD/NAD(P)-binding oxidoreductase family protein n=1 Tax=Artemisia annua TaxID=35608 RepID=A0A2U1MZ09_ARTAN|nr:FAD/NAD(P)-binding oxidoreductase family protein [Artemisia annua]